MAYEGIISEYGDDTTQLYLSEFELSRLEEQQRIINSVARLGLDMTVAEAMQKALLNIAEIAEGRDIILTHGVYDILHEGHTRHLNFASNLLPKKEGILAVAVWSDQNVRHWKGSDRPIHNIRDRITVLTSLKAVDCAFEVPYRDVSSGEKLSKPEVYRQRRELIRPIVEIARPKFYVVGESGKNEVIEHGGPHQTTVIVDPTYGEKRESTTRMDDLLRGRAGGTGVTAELIRSLNEFPEGE
ncbi:adenylyltransferase/cytidyltransferase family protein [Candidatus Saccharibacteria bacterium]|nr:adenylyltransferase/cytidyltransferase family protein [Candidatus Saccharibacteria bacterium]MCL1962715.1 adenylyltransferase/cytidyltransferase family protein [Candidatus Saccharibacteria bacterium]